MSCDRPTTNPPAANSAVSTTPAVPRKRTWDTCAALPESHVPLAQLDDAVRFDDDLGEPIRYDAERCLLRYRGIMSHASFVQLQKLSRDRHYQRALEQLFVATAFTQPPPSSSKPWAIWVGALSVAATVLAAGLWFAFGRHQPPTVSPTSNNAATHVLTSDNPTKITVVHASQTDPPDQRVSSHDAAR